MQIKGSVIIQTFFNLATSYFALSGSYELPVGAKKISPVIANPAGEAIQSTMS
jgi:hypothetical protein